VTREVVLSLASAAGRTGRGVRIAIVDSGIHAAHPHIGGVEAGAAIDADGQTQGDLIDRLGHGTAVAAAIHEKAPDATLLAVKIFDRALATNAATLAAAIRWASTQRVDLINLSLGTSNPDHEGLLAAVVADANAAGAIVVAAAPTPDAAWLPGALPGVVAVEMDWTCPRDTCVVRPGPRDQIRIVASGFPRPIPGVSPEHNLKGLSFAVANATGLLAVTIEGGSIRSMAALNERLRESA
jgi:subtilisin family serine protease